MPTMPTMPTMPISGYLLHGLMLGPPAAVPPCIGEVTAQLQREAYAELTVSAERCAADTGHPRSFYFLGVAHLALGQRARAILALGRYLARGITDEPPRLREIASGRLEQAKQEAGAVRLRISPHPPDTRVVVLPPSGPAFSVILGELEATPDGAQLWLDAGHNRVTVRNHGGLVTKELEIVAGAGETILDLSLRTAPPPPPPSPRPAPPMPFPRRPWLTLSGVVAGGTLLAGLVTLPVGTIRGNRRLDADPDSCEEGLELDRCRYLLADATALRGTGAGLFGAGLGTAAGGVTGLMATDRARRVAWSAEVGLGGAFGIAGAVLLAVGLKNLDQVNTSTEASPTPWAEHREAVRSPANVYSFGAGFLGAGVGLVASAAAGLITQRFAPRKQTRARWQVHPQGVVLRF